MKIETRCSTVKQFLHHLKNHNYELRITFIMKTVSLIHWKKYAVEFKISKENRHILAKKVIPFVTLFLDKLCIIIILQQSNRLFL